MQMQSSQRPNKNHFITKNGFLNATAVAIAPSDCDLFYRPRNPPIVTDIHQTVHRIIDVFSPFCFAKASVTRLPSNNHQFSQLISRYGRRSSFSSNPLNRFMCVCVSRICICLPIFLRSDSPGVPRPPLAESILSLRAARPVGVWMSSCEDVNWTDAADRVTRFVHRTPVTWRIS